jgi:hypothetical protein
MDKEKYSKNNQVGKSFEKKKKQYLQPELIIYGHMEKLTEGGGTTGSDVATMAKKM